MFRRALLLSLAAIALIAAPAAAQYDGVAGSTEVLDDGSIRVTGEGCEPDATISYDVTKDGAAFSSGTAQADAEGDFAFTVATDGAGDYQVTSTCGDQTFVLGATVAAAGTGGTGGTTTGGTTGAGTGTLPQTGSDSSIPFAQAGIALVMIGGVAVYEVGS